MFRTSVVAFGLIANACAPMGPAQMPATEASDVLTAFAAGAAPGDICTPEGRARLRGAVRAYSAAMASGGVPWPSMSDDAHSMDVSVLVAFAAGFVEASDFRWGGVRHEMGFSQWPEVRELRQSAREACAQAAALQQSAARFVLEAGRYQNLQQSAADAGVLARQAWRMQRARDELRVAQVGLAN